MFIGIKLLAIKSLVFTVQKACGKIRGHFIKINSAAENDLVRQLISPNYSEYIIFEDTGHQ